MKVPNLYISLKIDFEMYNKQFYSISLFNAASNGSPRTFVLTIKFV